MISEEIASKIEKQKETIIWNSRSIPVWFKEIQSELSDALNARRAPGWKDAEREHLIAIAALAIRALEVCNDE